MLNCKYKDKLFYKCEDKKNIGCKGVWKLYIALTENPGAAVSEGQIHKAHTEPYENHLVYAKKVNPQDEAAYLIKATAPQAQQEGDWLV